MNLYELLAHLEISGCNGNYQRMADERVTALCAIKQCDPKDLTIREVLGCIEAAQLDYNELLPLLFDTQPRALSAITADHTGSLT